MISFLRPGHYLPATVMMLDQGGHGLYPVAIVHIHDTIYLAYLGMMYVSADHTIEPAFATVGHEVLFELEDEIHGFLHTPLEVLAEAPVSEPQASTYPVETAV